MKKIFLLLSSLLTTFTQNSAHSIDPEKILKNLSLRDKIAQLCVVAAVSNEEKNQELMRQWKEWASYRLDQEYIENLIKNYHIGGVIFYGSNTTAQEQAALTKHFQSMSETPLLVSLDAETGLDDRLSEESVLCYPCAMALGATQDPSLIYRLGAQLAEQLKKIGVHLTCSPVIDVNSNPANPIIGRRSFGSEKTLVTAMGLALMNGLQDNGILACAKHFPGHGDTHQDSHETLPKVDRNQQQLEDIELYPFKKLIDAGIKSIMTAHLEVPALEEQKGLASSLSYSITTNLLKHKLGFKGLVITDALGMKGASDCAQPGELELKALQAGNDILLCPVDAAQAIDYIEQAVIRGEISEEEINAKVMKVLHAKVWALAHANQDNQSIEEVLKSREAKELQEILFSKAITLAQSSSQDPFSDTTQTKMIIAICDPEEANDETDMFGTKIPTQSVNVENNFEENLKADADHIILTIHTMKRFAKDNYGISQATIDLISSLKEQGKHVTVVLFGTPYAIPLVNHADTILVAYENWPEARKAVSDIISGKKIATGILPVKVN